MHLFILRFTFFPEWRQRPTFWGINPESVLDNDLHMSHRRVAVIPDENKNRNFDDSRWKKWFLIFLKKWRNDNPRKDIKSEKTRFVLFLKLKL